jgi:integrase
VAQGKWIGFEEDGMNEDKKTKVGRRDFLRAMGAGAGLIAQIPIFPTIPHLHVRTGFFDFDEWQQMRSHFRREDFRDAADFAFLTGWRQMEVLGLHWRNVDLSAREVRLDEGSTKTGAGRVFPFAGYPQLAEVIKRRVAVRERLQRR